MHVDTGASGYRHLSKFLYYELFVLISKLFACMHTCTVTVTEFNLNAKITYFNPSMFYRLECQTFVTGCRFHTKKKQTTRPFNY